MSCLYKRSLKCVIVGDEGVGKKNLVKAYCTSVLKVGNYSPDYPLVFVYTDTTTKRPLVPFSLVVGPEAKNLRILSYLKADVVIICFPLDSPNSFDNVKTKWLPEVCQHCPNGSVIIAGIKSNTENELIENTQAKELANSVNAKYFECSIFLIASLKKLIDGAVCEADPPIAMQGFLTRVGGAVK